MPLAELCYFHDTKIFHRTNLKILFENMIIDTRPKNFWVFLDLKRHLLPWIIIDIVKNGKKLLNKSFLFIRSKYINVIEHE